MLDSQSLDKHEFNEVDISAVFDLIVFSYQGVRMYSKLIICTGILTHSMLPTSATFFLMSIHDYHSIKNACLQVDRF